MNLLGWHRMFFEKKFEGKTSTWLLETPTKTTATPKDD